MHCTRPCLVYSYISPTYHLVHACLHCSLVCSRITPSLHHQGFRSQPAKREDLPIDNCRTVVLRKISSYSKIIAWPTGVMSKSQIENQRWRRVFQKMRQLVRVSRPCEELQASYLTRAKARFSRKQPKHVLSDKVPTISGVCKANFEHSRGAEPQKSTPPRYKNKQRKRAPSNRLPPIPEDCETRFEETPKAEPLNTEYKKVKSLKSKPQQHSQVSHRLEQEERNPTFITHSSILENLIAIWINHGGSVVVVVLLGALASSFIC